MTRDEILQQHPLDAYLRSIGIVLRGSGVERTATRCAKTQHRKDHWCVQINVQKQIFTCHDCKIGGSIIDWWAIERGQSIGAVLNTFQTEPQSVARVTQSMIKAIYDYRNESGELVYQSVRMEPKSFRQRRPDENGGWIWNMDGVTRVLFNLQEVLNSKQIAICEGEKDALTLGSGSYVATCNVGGAGKWMAAYGEQLKGKDILIFPDNDTAGRKHAADVLASLNGRANSVKLVIIPEPYKDITEFIESFAEREQAWRELAALTERTAHSIKPIPVYTLEEMEALYFDHAKTRASHQFDLGKFLPEFRDYIQPMVPGEMLLLLADTGTGKSSALSNMMRAAWPLPCLFFEMELPLTLMFERHVQMEVGCEAIDVRRDYCDNTQPLWNNYRRLQHIAVCPESGISVAEIESLIVRSELKLGMRPIVVAVDYVGLLNSQGSRSRYEAISNAAEQLKVIAKRTNTIMLVASQITRPDKDTLEIGLHDGRDSGALENSAGIVIGAWRPERHRIMFKILKNTSGSSGAVIEAKMDGAKMQITSLSKIP